MVEVGRIFEIAERRYAMTLGTLLGTGRTIVDANGPAPRRSVSRRVSSRAVIIEAFGAYLLSVANYRRGY
jgi:hypothetical protein